MQTAEWGVGVTFSNFFFPWPVKNLSSQVSTLFLVYEISQLLFFCALKVAKVGPLGWAFIVGPAPVGACQSHVVRCGSCRLRPVVTAAITALPGSMLALSYITPSTWPNLDPWSHSIFDVDHTTPPCLSLSPLFCS